MFTTKFILINYILKRVTFIPNYYIYYILDKYAIFWRTISKRVVKLGLFEHFLNFKYLVRKENLKEKKIIETWKISSIVILQNHTSLEIICIYHQNYRNINFCNKRIIQLPHKLNRFQILLDISTTHLLLSFKQVPSTIKNRKYFLYCFSWSVSPHNLGRLPLQNHYYLPSPLILFLKNSTDRWKVWFKKKKIYISPPFFPGLDWLGGGRLSRVKLDDAFDVFAFHPWPHTGGRKWPRLNFI